MEEYKATFPVLDRMFEVMDANGKKIHAVAEMTEIREETIRSWRKRGNLPPLDKLEMICNALDISLAQFFNTDPDSFIARGEDAVFLKNWHDLNREDREIVDRLIGELLKKQRKQ